MIHTLILEDEPKNAALLSKILENNFPELRIDGICEDKKSAIQYLQNNEAQLIFMDIMLKDGNSFEIFEHVNLSNSHIIFTTAHDQYAIKAIKFCAMDYLLKPLDIEDLTMAVHKAKDRISKNEKNAQQLNAFSMNKEKLTKVALPSMEGHTFVNLNDIYYIQSEGSYSTFFMKDNHKYIVSRQIKEYEEMLDGSGFFRIHQSFIINLLYIKRYIKGSGGTVIMDNGKEIDVAVRRKEEFLKKTHIH
jgi:two-component system, LytTR family, response regulator